MIYTTLNRIRAYGPHTDSWMKLLTHTGKTKADDEPVEMTAILQSNGLDDALWCLRVEPQHASIWRLLAVHYARQVQHLMTDPRSLAALDVAERHAHGMATDMELGAAYDAATAIGARRATRAAEFAARAAARAAEWNAPRAPEWVARLALEAATGWEPKEAAREKQACDLRTVLEHYDASPGCEIHGWRTE
jgi:hypothetical protein